MRREEAVASTLFEYVKAAGDHEWVVQRSYSLHSVLDDVRELVTESEGEEGTGEDYEASLPSELPYEESNDGRIHRRPYELVREELPYWVGDGGVPAVDFEGQGLVESVDFLPGHSTVISLSSPGKRTVGCSSIGISFWSASQSISFSSLMPSWVNDDMNT